MINFKVNRFILYVKSCGGILTSTTLAVLVFLFMIPIVVVARYYSITSSLLYIMGCLVIIQKLSRLFSRKNAEVKNIKENSDQLDITVLTPASEWEKYIYTYAISMIYAPALILLIWLGGGRFYSIHFEAVSSMFYTLDVRLCLELGACVCILLNLFFLLPLFLNHSFSKMKKMIIGLSFILSTIILLMICVDIVSIHKFIYSQSDGILNLSVIGDLFLSHADSNLLAVSIYRPTIDLFMFVVLLFLFGLGYKKFRQRQYY